MAVLAPPKSWCPPTVMPPNLKGGDAKEGGLGGTCGGGGGTGQRGKGAARPNVGGRLPHRRFPGAWGGARPQGMPLVGRVGERERQGGWGGCRLA